MAEIPKLCFNRTILKIFSSGAKHENSQQITVTQKVMGYMI